MASARASRSSSFVTGGASNTVATPSSNVTSVLTVATCFSPLCSVPRAVCVVFPAFAFLHNSLSPPYARMRLLDAGERTIELVPLAALL